MPKLLFSVLLSPGTLHAQELDASQGDVAALSRAICHRDLATGEGLLVGVLRDRFGEPRPGLHVLAMWTELEIRADGNRTLLRASADTSDADGTFVLCGLPLETALTMRAGSDRDGTGQLNVQVPASGLLRRELVVSGRDALASVVGRVLDESGRPLTAYATLEGDSTRLVRSDSSGAFRIDAVPQRSGQLLLRAVGRTPRWIDIEPDVGRVDVGDITLSQIVQTLPEVSVRERMLAEREREFEYRRSVLRGYFFDEADLAMYPRVTAGALAGRSPSLRGEPRGILAFERGFRRCIPRYWFDGVDWGNRVTGDVLEDFLRRAKRVEIYFAQFAPPEFTDFDGCGAVVVWTS